LDEFIEKWENCSGHERSNYAAFLSDFAHVMDVPTPGPGGTQSLGDYQFDGPVAGGSEGGNTGFIDLYKRGHFILEAKQSKVCEIPSLPGLDASPAPEQGSRYDELMRRAFRQARRYAVNLPSDHPWPPFIVVLDVGRAFELYFDYAGNGRDYRFFPDRASYRIPISALASPDKVANTEKSRLELLRAIWTDPRALDPRLRTSRVTRDIAQRLASVSKWMEETQRLKSADAADWERSLAVEETSLFLMRVLFCMFAEDIGLFGNDPKTDRPFADFLRETLTHDRQFEKGLEDLWISMGRAHRSDRWSHALNRDVAYFNGALFLDTKVYVLAQAERGELLRAAEHDWQNVEPAIFGTLLEQALTPGERAKLGAHYTPRPYVERIVEATITDVLRPEWEALEAGLEGLGKAEALERLRAFHDRLADIRVLDPACGTGNFLYVAMEALLGLENKVVQAIEDLGGEVRSRIGPGQFHGLEKNPRAAKIAELVLWIGWLRWNIRNGAGEITEPILGQRANVNFGRPGGYDAVLAQDETGAPDLSDPRQPEWPEADFIVGNPPFIGKGADMRRELGDQYVEALRRANPRVPASVDFVMQWWDRAAQILSAPNGRLLRFGYVTTNSIRQTFNRKVLSSAGLGSSFSLAFSVPDHPWYKISSSPGSKGRKSKREKTAAVRIAMTVAEAGKLEGDLWEVEHEGSLESDSPVIRYSRTRSLINSDLSVGPDITEAQPLKSNSMLCYNGMMLASQGFKIDRRLAEQLLSRPNFLGRSIVNLYMEGSDLTDYGPRGYIIDFTGFSDAEARQGFPDAYQHILQTVKPDRSRNTDKGFRERWWLFGRTRGKLREALNGLQRYIGTTETAKHRFFQFIPTTIVPDHMVVSIGIEDAYHLGVLSSRIHTRWSLRAGARLGMGNDPRYSKSKVFDPFPFPSPTRDQRSHIAELAEELDATRKLALAEVPRLTMTELYNLRERIAAGETLTGADLTRATAARAFIVHQLHEEIDRAVADAYGWPHDLSPSEIVARLVALNHVRKAEEESGIVRWLRPDYQRPRFADKETSH
jgi:hypothetical protein